MKHIQHSIMTSTPSEDLSSPRKETMQQHDAKVEEQPNSPSTAATTEDSIVTFDGEGEFEHTLHDFENVACDLLLMPHYDRDDKLQQDDAFLLAEEVWVSWLCQALPDNVFDLFNVEDNEDEDLVCELASQTSSEYSDESSESSCSQNSSLEQDDEDCWLEFENNNENIETTNVIRRPDFSYFGLPTIMEEDDQELLEIQRDDDLLGEALLGAYPRTQHTDLVATGNVLIGRELRRSFSC